MLPCPFCGAEVTAVRTRKARGLERFYAEPGMRHAAGCPLTSTLSVRAYGRSPDEAVHALRESWNTRGATHSAETAGDVD